MKRPAYRSVWIEILLRATHDGADVMFGGKRIRLEPGQFTTGTNVISESTGVPRGTVVRILETFKNEHQIEQRTDRQCSMITVLKWKEYQESEQRNEQRVNNERATNEQRVNTKQECNNEKNERMEEPDSEATIVAHTPKDIAKKFFEDELSQNEAITALVEKGISPEQARSEILKFISYWTEPERSGKRQRWEREPTFEIGRRLATWMSRVKTQQTSIKPSQQWQVI